MSSSTAELVAALREKHGLTEASNAPKSLSDLTALARRQLAEAQEPAKKKSGGVKDAKPSENLPEDCLKAANHFRDCVKDGEKLEQAAKDVADAAKMVPAAEDALSAKRAALDVEKSVERMKTAVDSVYGSYAQGRQVFYSVALAWDLYSPPASEKKPPSSDVKALSDKDMADQIGFAAKNLQTNVRDFLEKAAAANKLFRAAARKMGLEQGEVSDSEKQALTAAGFAVRTAADPLFGRTQGIQRRAGELVARARSKEKYESVAAGPDLCVENDSEIGGLDLV